MKEIVRSRRVKLNQLESVNKGKYLIALLGHCKNFYQFLITIQNTHGASLYVYEDGETAPAMFGKPIDEFKKQRFQDPDELQMLLGIAGLD